MIWKTQVSAWNTVEVVSRLPHRNTSSRIVLVAMMVCPATTPTRAQIRMTSMARSRSGGVRASTSVGRGNSAVTLMK